MRGDDNPHALTNREPIIFTTFPAILTGQYRGKDRRTTPKTTLQEKDETEPLK